MGAYQQVSELLIERGYGAVPIMPGTKAPGFFCAGMWIGLANWQKRFNNGPPPADERARWAAGDSGVGVLGGKGSHGLVGVDIDTDGLCHSLLCLELSCRQPEFAKSAIAARPCSITVPTFSESKQLVHQRQVHRRADRARATNGVAADDCIPNRCSLLLVRIGQARGPGAA